MITFVDPNCFKNIHLSFNKKLLLLLNERLQKKTWIGDREYGKKLFDDIAVKKQSWDYSSNYNIWIGIRRYFCIFYYLIRNSEKNIWFLSVDNTYFPIFALILSPFLRQKTIHVVIHNNLRTLSISATKRKLFSLLNNTLDLHYIVLTEEMKMVWDSSFDQKAILLKHPICGNDRASEIDFSNQETTFLLVGRQAEIWIKEGKMQSFKIAFSNSNVKVKILVSSNLLNCHKKHTNITLDKLPKYMPTSAYEEAFKQTTFVLFPASDEINYRASGVLLDTIARGRIFIAPQQGHFKEFGNCGLFYSYNNLEEILHKAAQMNKLELNKLIQSGNEKRTKIEMQNKKCIQSLILQ